MLIVVAMFLRLCYAKASAYNLFSNVRLDQHLELTTKSVAIKLRLDAQIQTLLAVLLYLLVTTQIYNKMFAPLRPRI